MLALCRTLTDCLRAMEALVTSRMVLRESHGEQHVLVETTGFVEITRRILRALSSGPSVSTLAGHYLSVEDAWAASRDLSVRAGHGGAADCA